MTIWKTKENIERQYYNQITCTLTTYMILTLNTGLTMGESQWSATTRQNFGHFSRSLAVLVLVTMEKKLLFHTLLGDTK
jgi:hypothetical protein